MKFLALKLYLVVRISLTLILSPAIIGCFRKVNFPGFYLVISNFQSSAFLSAPCELSEKYAVLCGNKAILGKYEKSYFV